VIRLSTSPTCESGGVDAARGYRESSAAAIAVTSGRGAPSPEGWQEDARSHLNGSGLAVGADAALLGASAAMGSVLLPRGGCVDVCYASLPKL